MFIYNITIKVNNAIQDEWMQWQQEVHIPEIMLTGLFERYQVFRLLDQDDAEGPTFIFQFHTASEENYRRYLREFAPGLREEAFEKWDPGFIAFRSLLRSVQ